MIINEMTHEDVLDVFLKTMKYYIDNDYLVEFEGDHVVDVDVENKKINYTIQISVAPWALNSKTPLVYQKGLFDYMNVYKRLSDAHVNKTRKKMEANGNGNTKRND